MDQATWSAKWVRECLQKGTGKTFDVKPVVVFPGWYVDRQKMVTHSNAWVLNPKAIAAFSENEKTKLSEEDVRLASVCMELYIRNG